MKYPITIILIPLLFLFIQPVYSEEKIVDWTKKSAKQGDAEAQNNLGVMYDKGQGVPQNYKKAFDWFKKSAKQDFAKAQYNLGMIYYEGEEVSKNDKKAIYWINTLV